MRVIDDGADDRGCRSKLYRVLRSILVFYVRREEQIGSWAFLTYEAYTGFFTYHGFVIITTSSRIISRDSACKGSVVLQANILLK
jgi:hypothetical protein